MFSQSAVRYLISETLTVPLESIMVASPVSFSGRYHDGTEKGYWPLLAEGLRWRPRSFWI